MSKFELSLRSVVIALVLMAISLFVLAVFADTGRSQERPAAADPLHMEIVRTPR